MAGHFVLFALLAISFPFLALATDPNQLQDFCVADKASKVFVNGFVCKDPNQVNADDFFSNALNMPGDTNNPLGSKVTAVNVNNLAGLNTLGVSLARIDFAPLGLNPPHTHPRATEVLTVLDGTLLVGFVTSDNSGNPHLNNKLFTKTLNKGDTFVFPQGLIHFQKNICGWRNAVALSGLSSQNPGVITIANAVFGATPSIPDDLLAKAFQIDKRLVDGLQAMSWTNNN